MKYSKVSVLVPTRKRIEYLKRMLASYEATVGRAEDSELVFRCDWDDMETLQFLSRYDWTTIVGPRREGYKSLPSFYNEMVKVATGDLYICGNDDLLFQTKAWPALVIEEANKYPDGLFNIGVSTGLNEDKFPFSIVSKQLVDALGKINDERLLFSDVFLLDVAKHFGRNIRLETVMFQHDWAGYGEDETRREANRHEFGEVFANAKGDWSEAYRQRHDAVVAEAIGKLDASGDFLAGSTLCRYESHQGLVGLSSPLWPEAAGRVKWGSRRGGKDIHYGRGETLELLKVLSTAGIRRGTTILSSFLMGMPSLLWGSAFDTVLTVIPETAKCEEVRDGRHLLLPGRLDDTRFLYRVLDKAGSINVLVLDEDRYANLISPYFLLARAITRPGMVVFVNTKCPAEASNASVHRFIADLSSGHLDGRCHDIRHVAPTDGAGLSYELFRIGLESEK